MFGLVPSAYCSSGCATIWPSAKPLGRLINTHPFWYIELHCL